MVEKGWPPGEQPSFEWTEQRGIKNVLLGSKGKPDPEEGRSLRFVVFPWGVGWAKGDERVSALWSEVTHVWHNVTAHTVNSLPSYTDYRYMLRFANGVQTRWFGGWLAARDVKKSQATSLEPVARVTTIVTIEQFGRLLDSAVTRVQLPKAVDLLNTGQTVSLGPFTLSRDCITADEKSLSWKEIKEVQVQQGVVSVNKAGRWRAWGKARVSQIPNFFVFDALVRLLMAQKTGPSA